MYRYTHASATNRGQLSLIALLFIIVGCSKPPRVPLHEVKDYGSNPGELRMFKYVPDSPETHRSTGVKKDSKGRDHVSGTETQPVPGAPLVVALHGCMQDAVEYGEDSGWVRLADRWGFLLLLPEQRRGNNLLRCFNWFSPDDHRRDAGEALSIRQMIDRMKRDHAIDPQRIYVTGVSAGGAMTLGLLAVYPEVFAGGAPLAGIAFGCADGLVSGLDCMRNPPGKSAPAWGTAVRSATNYKGPWPRVSVWQGNADSAVDPKNATAIVRQWTNVQGIDDTPEQAHTPRGHVHSLYRDSNREILVESYHIEDMGHGVPVDPGPGEDQCGRAGKYFPDVDICSSRYIAEFWGLDR